MELLIWKKHDSRNEILVNKNWNCRKVTADKTVSKTAVALFINAILEICFMKNG